MPDGLHHLNRIVPDRPAEQMVTFAASAPADHAVVAACAEAGCGAWRSGWDTVVDETTELGRRQAAYIRMSSRRTFRELRSGEGLTVFRFASGQRCFQDHRTRPTTYRVKDGDWRGIFGPGRRHSRVDDWVEDFAEHLDDLNDQYDQG